MRYYRFRFLNSRDSRLREYVVASTHEPDALIAAWFLLRAGELGELGPFQREDWRVLSVVITPVVDLAAALSS